MKKKYYIKNRYFLTIIILLFIFFVWKHFSEKKRVLGISTQTKLITLNDNGFSQSVKSNANSVGELLKEQQIQLDDYDRVYPEKQAKLISKMTIYIQRAKNISVFVDKKKLKIYGFGNTIEKILQENNIYLKKEDIVIPSRQTIIYNNLKVKIIHVEIREEIVKKKIKFKTIYEENKKLSWRKEKIKQKGMLGSKELKYKVAYHNNKEVSRKMIATKIIKEPTNEIIMKGSYIKFGKSHKGVASWYAHTGTMSAANPWLPIGSYVKVTNQNNGKSVIVKINDRGPFGNGRIIDLDKVAFAKIANIRQGTVNIKMEEILN